MQKYQPDHWQLGSGLPNRRGGSRRAPAVGEAVAGRADAPTDAAGAVRHPGRRCHNSGGRSRLCRYQYW